MSIQDKYAEALDQKICFHRLVWNKAEPYFRVLVEIDLGVNSGFAESRYILKADGHPINSLYRTAEGKYVSLTPIDFIASRSYHELVVEDASGHTVGRALVNLLPSRQLLAFYSIKDGLLCANDDGPQDNKDSWLVVCDASVQFTPELEPRFGFDYGVHFGVLPKGFDKKITAKRLSKTLWKLSAPKESVRKTKSDWRSLIRVELGFGSNGQIQLPRIGENVPLAIFNLPNKIQLHRVLMDGVALPFEVTYATASVTECVIDERVLTVGMPVILEMTYKGASYETVRHLKCDVKGGAFHLRSGQTVFLSASRELPYRYARDGMLELMLPKLSSDEKKSLALFQGEELVCKFPKRKQNLSELKATGAPIVLRRKFNCDAQNTLVLSKAVCDAGAVEKFTFDGKNCKIQLRGIAEFSSHHAAVLWNPLEDKVTSSNNLILRDGCMELSAPDHSAYGLSYKGHWVGGVVQGAMEYVSKKRECSLTDFALIRWFHAPVLSPEYTAGFQEIVQQNVDLALSAWLFDNGLPDGLSFDFDRSTWIIILRTLLFSWNPNQETLIRFVQNIQSLSMKSPRQGANVPLLIQDVIPLLMRDVACVWERSIAPDKSKNELLITWANILAGLEPGASAEALENAKLRLRKNLIDSFDVDDSFMDSLLKSALTISSNKNNFTIQNVRTALGHAAFRKLLGINSLYRT